MSQLDLEQLEYEGEEHLAELQPAPGKATLTSRIGKSARPGSASDVIDGATHAHLMGGLGVELSRGDGGGGGGGPPGAKKAGLGLGYLGNQGIEAGGDLGGDHVEEKPLGRGLEFLSGNNPASSGLPSGKLLDQQREVKQFDSAGDFYDQRATVDAKLTDTKLHKPFKKKGKSKDEEHEGGEEEHDELAHKPFKAGPADLAVMPGVGVGGPVPIPYPNAGGGGGDLKGQQREVVNFDAKAGDDFYDQRATVEVGSKNFGTYDPVEHLTGKQPGGIDGLMSTKSLAPSMALNAATDLKSQAREVVNFDAKAGDDFYDQRATVDVDVGKKVAGKNESDIKAIDGGMKEAGEKADHAMIAAGTGLVTGLVSGASAISGAGAGPVVSGAQVAEQAANAAMAGVGETPVEDGKSAADAASQLLMQGGASAAHEAINATVTAGQAAQGAKTADVPLNMINPDLKQPDGAKGDVPLNMINPDLKKPDAKGELPLDAINPDLKKPGATGELPLDAINPDLKKPTAKGELPLDAINPDLKKPRGRDELIDPWGDDEALYDPNALDAIDPDHQKPVDGDPKVDAKVDPALDAKIDLAKANPQQSKEILKGVAADAQAKKTATYQKVEAKGAAITKAGAKVAAGAVAKGGKKVSNVAGKGTIIVDAKKKEGEKKKFEKAKSIDELKARLNKSLTDETTKLKESITKQKTDLQTKLKTEKDKIDGEMKTQADALAKQLADKNKDIDKQLAEKKKAFDKQIADDKKKAETTCKTEQTKTKETTAKEVAKIEKAGRDEANKVTAAAAKEAGAARSAGQAKANAARSAANNKAAGIEDAAQKAAAQSAGNNQAQGAINAANAKAKQITDAAKAEADKRKALTTTLVAETKAKGDQAVQDLGTKLQTSLTEINGKATKGLADMDAARQKMVAEVKAFEDKAKQENAKKNEEAKFKIHTLEVESTKKIADMETNGLKAITAKRDDMLMKLEKGSAADLAKLEEETNKICGDIEKSVGDTTKAVNEEIAMAQKKSAFEAQKRVDAIKADGKKQIDELDKKVKDVQAKIEAIDAETKAGLKKAADDAKLAMEKQGEDGRNAIVAGADKAVADLAKTSDQYAADKKAEEEAAAKQKADEEKAAADKVKADKEAEAKKEADKKAEEEKKKKEFEAKTKGAADALFKAMDGWGTDEKAIMGALKGKTPEEIAAIKKAYEEKTGRSLDKDLASEMDGNDLKEAKALMSDDPVQKAVAELQNSVSFWSTDRDKIKGTLDGITDPELRKKVVAEYEKATGTRLEKMLSEEGVKGVDSAAYAKPEDGPTGPMRDLSEEEKKKSRDAVGELEGAMNRWGTDEAKLMAALKGKSPEELAFIKAEFKRRNNGKSLDSVLEDELSGTDLKEAKGLMSGDPVQAAVAQLHSAADGLGTDKDKVLSTLKDIKDPEIRKKVAAEYEKQTGDSLGAMLEDELSGNSKDLAKALAGGPDGKVNQGEVAAIEADAAMSGGFLTDIADGIADTVGADRKMMRSAVGGIVAVAVLGPLAGPVLAFGGGAMIGTDIGGTDEEALYKALESCADQKERDELKRIYQERTGRTLDDALKSELKPKEKDVTDALMAGDKTTAEAAKIAAAADGVGTDRKALYAALEGKNLDERRAIIAAFNKKYGSEYPETEIDVPDPANPGKTMKKKVSGFDAMCADELDSLDRQKAEQIAENGKMDDGFALYYAMNEGFMGIGTDDALLKERLKGKSKDEIKKITEDYRKAKALQEGKKLEDIPADALKTDVGGETSGRVGHDLNQALKGKPETPQEILDRAREDYNFERHDSGWMGEVGVLVLGGPLAYGAMKLAGKTPADISNGITDTWSDSGKRLDEDFKELERQFNAAKLKAETDPKIMALPEDQRKKAIEASMMKDLKESGQADYVDGSIKQFGEAKDATADAVGTAVAIAVGAVITIASGGTAAPALVALISGLAGVSAKMIMKGATMSNEELVQELAQVAAEALAAGFVNLKSINGAIEKLAGKFGEGLAAKIIKEALEEAVEGMSEEIILALLDENLYKGDLADFASQLGGRVGKAALTGAAAAVVSTGFGDVMPGMKKLAGSGIHGKAVSGAINQAVGAAFTTAIDPNTYNGSGGDVALAFGKSMGSAALRGLQDGYSTGEGFKSGEGWKSGPTTKHNTKATDSNNASASTQTTGTTTSSSGDTSVDVNTEVDVKKGPTEVKVDAKADTTIVGPDGTQTASDSTSKTIPLGPDGKPVDPNATTQPVKVDPNGKTQPIDADTLVDKDPTDNKGTPLDGKKGADPNSKTEVDADAKTQAAIEAAKKAHGDGDPKALESAIKALPGAGNVEVVADGFIGPLKPNQITARTAAKVISMFDAAMKTPVGRDAVKALQDLGVTLTLNTGEGSFRQGNRINIDPSMASDGNELAGILAHEAHHAKTFDKDVDINTTRDQYVAATLKNEAQAQAALFEHYQQTGSTEGASRQFGAAEYFGAYDAAAKAFQAANPNATAEQMHAAGKAAGIAALQAVFGSATPSTSVDDDGNIKPGEPATYADLYGQWHDAHSPQGLVAQNTGAPIPATQAAPANVTPVEGPDPKLVALTQKAFDKYSAALGPAKALLQGLLGKFGEVMGRAKDAVSAANRLQRAIDNFGAKVTDVDSVIANIWDAIGTRVVLSNASPETMAQAVAALQEGIKSGQLKITMINNLHGADAKPYFTADQVAALAAEQHAANGKEVTTNASKIMAGGFTSVCIYVEYANGVKGEIQIIGEQALAIANVEHIPYDVGLGKPLVRGIDSSLQGELKAITGPIEAAIKAVNADPALKAAYDKYLSEMYAHARNIEMGLESNPPVLPAGLDQALSVEGLQAVHAAIEALKAKQKALEAEKKTDDQKSPSPAVKVIANPEADAMPPPQGKEQLLEFALKKYGNVLAKYVNAPHGSNPKFDTLLGELQALEPGEWANNPEKAQAALDQWIALSHEIETESGKSEADLREVYNILEKTDMPRWLAMMEGKTDKEKAEALYEMRKQWRILVRDLMTDEKSKEILYLRDRALSGHRTGPAMQDLLDRNLKKTNGDVDAAYRRIVESAMRPNEKVNKGITGSETGIKSDVAPEVKGPKAPLPKQNSDTDVKSAADLKLAAEQEAKNKAALKDSEQARLEARNRLGVEGEEGKHGGVEVHSHWLGVVKSDVFADKFADKGQQNGWMNVLKTIDGLKGTPLAHTLFNTGSIKERGPAGDAIRIATEAFDSLKGSDPTHPALQDFKAKHSGDPDFDEKFNALRESLAEQICRKCLEASGETDFNSAYEIRDELIKAKFGGDKAANETDDQKKARESAAYQELSRLTILRLIDDGIVLTEQSNSIAKLTKRFGPKVMQAALNDAMSEIQARDGKERADELRKTFKVAFLSMGLSVFYGEQDRRSEGSVERLIADNEGLPKSVREEYAALRANLETLTGDARQAERLRIENMLNVRGWVTELASQFGGAQAKAVLELEQQNLQKKLAEEQARGIQGVATQRRLAEIAEYLQVLAASPHLMGIEKGAVTGEHTVGIDTAGQELYEFTAEGKQRFKIMYMALVRAAEAKGERLVFRPHVGEGAINPERGAVWNAKDGRWEKDGKPIHYERAANNVGAMIEVINELLDAGLLRPDIITIRFGHATHTTPAQAAELAALRTKANLSVIAEVNLGSNIATNVVDQHTDADGKKVDKKGEEDFTDHSFLTLIFNDIQTILSTDGHAVEKTSMGKEYKRAYDLIESFLAGNMPLRVTPEQAAAAGFKRGTPGKDGVVELSVNELTDAELQKFLHAYENLFKWAAEYHDPKGTQRGGTPLPKVPAPVTPAPRDPAVAERLRRALEARGLDADTFDSDQLDDQSAAKVARALLDDPMHPQSASKQTPEIAEARKRAEKWALERANGDPREFANLYEYARVLFSNHKREAEKALKGVTPPKGMNKDKMAGNEAAAKMTAAAIDAELEIDLAAVAKLGPGQNQIVMDPNDSPADIAAKVQTLERVPYQSPAAEAYHAQKHAKELDGLTEIPAGDAVTRFAEATKLTLTQGTVFKAEVSETGSIRIILRREFTKDDGTTATLEAIVYVQPDGRVVIATFGGAKAK